MSEYEFKRMSLKERGHFPNTFRLFPIRSIKTSTLGIEILKRAKWVFIPWAEITDAYIEKKPSVKGYGAGTGIDYYKRTCVLVTKFGTFKFDVSNSFPDFKENKALKEVLHNNLKLTLVKRTKRNEHIFNAIFMSALILLIWWLW